MKAFIKEFLRSGMTRGWLLSVLSVPLATLPTTNKAETMTFGQPPIENLDRIRAELVTHLTKSSERDDPAGPDGIVSEKGEHAQQLQWGNWPNRNNWGNWRNW